MSYAIHLRCFGHFRYNCKAKLKQPNVPESVQLEFLNDIKQYDETFEKDKIIVFHPIPMVKFNTAKFNTRCLLGHSLRLQK